MVQSDFGDQTSFRSLSRSKITHNIDNESIVLIMNVRVIMAIIIKIILPTFIETLTTPARYAYRTRVRLDIQWAQTITI